MKNLEKNSWFLPYPKVNDDHPVVANPYVYWRGWVNAHSRCCFLDIKTKLPVEQAIVINLTTNKWGEVSFNL